ncbi:MAG: M1 family metallopeptidase [Bacteroidetes bacterium]|nr:M1 family metallopeptidase [Bacteroidota bacterium]
MIRFLLFMGVFSLLVHQASAQSGLFLQRNLQKTYDRGTRSLDGKPGPNYWQNKASYTIEASLDTKKRLLKGVETIVYANNSPDSLKILRLKLAHDMYKKGGVRDSEINPDDIDEGVKVEFLRLNGTTIGEKDLKRHETFLDVKLKSAPVAPHSTVQLQIAWSYTLPADPNATRECRCDPSTYFVAYWFPQVAVYDDLQGWASKPYTGLQEFYNDFSDYDVRITVPKTHMLWATGEWQNAADMLEAPFYANFQAAHTAETVQPVFTEADLKKGGVFKKAKNHVFHYIAKDVPDVSFATSDHYNWDARSVLVDDKTGRRTFVSAVYASDAQDFRKVADIAARGIRLMSTWLPGYPFPYPCETVVHGNDGMEYPMMVNDWSMGQNDPTGLTAHEVSHTYFPFMMGINEQNYAWMDEGWASFFDHFLEDSLNNTQSNQLRWYPMVAGSDSDVPPMVLSQYLNAPAYGTASYSRPQSAYVVLMDQLGYEKFHSCMVAYMDRWKSRHPSPYDFFYTWNDVAGQSLDWLWKPWFFEWGYPDLGIAGVVNNEAAHSANITIARVGNLPVPVWLQIRYADGSSETIHKTPDVWKDGKKSIQIAAAAGKTVLFLQLGNRNVPDSNPKDNTWKP